jgi:phage-related protein
MALDTFTPPVPPSPGTKTKFTPKLRKVEFGDGYTQVTRDGLNHLRRQVPLTWEALTIAQAQALEDFFVGKGGDTPFLYALSDDSVRQWRCEDWERERNGPNTFTATLIQDFSIVS